MRMLIAVLLAGAAATPLLAQPDEVHHDQKQIHADHHEAQADHREVRQDRAQVQQDRARGNPAQAQRDRAELARDRQDMQHDQAARRLDQTELQRDRAAHASGFNNSPADRRMDQAYGRADARDARQDYRRDVNDAHRDDRGRFDARPGGRPGGQWNRSWRGDRRFDWQGYRATHRALFRGPRWYAPRGYAYRRFSVGFRFAPVFYAENYWIADPWAYRLPPAYWPYRWVRYYDDVALVDMQSGTIVDMIYDFFE